MPNKLMIVTKFDVFITFHNLLIFGFLLPKLIKWKKYKQDYLITIEEINNFTIVFLSFWFCTYLMYLLIHM